MNNNQKPTNRKKLRKLAERELGRRLTLEQMTRLKDYCVCVGAPTTAFMVEGLRGGITVQEAQIVLALADLELAQRRGPDYSH